MESDERDTRRLASFDAAEERHHLRRSPDQPGVTRLQKIRLELFALQCLDRQSSLVSIDDFEWTLRQLELARASLAELIDAIAPDPRAAAVTAAAEALARAEALLRGLDETLIDPVDPA